MATVVAEDMSLTKDTQTNSCFSSVDTWEGTCLNWLSQCPLPWEMPEGSGGRARI